MLGCSSETFFFSEILCTLADVTYLSLAWPPNTCVKQYPQKKTPNTNPDSCLLHPNCFAKVCAQTGVAIRVQYSRQVTNSSIRVHARISDLQQQRKTNGFNFINCNATKGVPFLIFQMGYKKDFHFARCPFFGIVVVVGSM